ncbi:hypothetical protein [Faecalibacter macacae]|uniref:Uncharacterized protein n=1 Tax=Faecalibacter macacae TaxID=1859289 RepID=A0A3L9MCT9_9FLAO|nr:hypothetical protein [Faecalibacter macacae]RLZ08339.1 hypothetical protein EAH69_10430 [Faecalibacter macacae]
MSNKYFYFFCLLFCFIININAQEIKVSQIDYKILTPKGNHKITESHYQNLADRLQSQFKNRVSFSNQSPFLIRPQIEILNEHTAGEVQDIKVLKLSIQLIIENQELNASFHSFEKTLLVTADNSNLAIHKAIKELRPTDMGLINFLKDGELKIQKFYSENCNKIIHSAKVKIDRKEYTDAFNLLRYVPEGIECSKEIENLITSIYDSYKNEYCNKQLHSAKLLAANESYELALSQLRFIDPEISCNNDVTALINKIGDKVNQETIRNFELEKDRFSKQSELEKIKLIINSEHEVNFHITN